MQFMCNHVRCAPEPSDTVNPFSQLQDPIDGFAEAVSPVATADTPQTYNIGY